MTGSLPTTGAGHPLSCPYEVQTMLTRPPPLLPCLDYRRRFKGGPGRFLIQRLGRGQGVTLLTISFVRSTTPAANPAAALAGGVSGALGWGRVGATFFACSN